MYFLFWRSHSAEIWAEGAFRRTPARRTVIPALQKKTEGLDKTVVRPVGATKQMFPISVEMSRKQPQNRSPVPGRGCCQPRYHDSCYCLPRPGATDVLPAIAVLLVPGAEHPLSKIPFLPTCRRPSPRTTPAPGSSEPPRCGRPVERRGERAELV